MHFERVIMRRLHPGPKPVLAVRFEFSINLPRGSLYICCNAVHSGRGCLCLWVRSAHVLLAGLGCVEANLHFLVCFIACGLYDPSMRLFYHCV